MATTWDIELVQLPGSPTGTATHPGETTKPFALTGLNSGTSYEFYVRSDCGGSTSSWVGPFQFQTDPTCEDPSNLTASNFTSSSAELSWTENGTATLWDIEVVDAGISPTQTPTETNVTNPKVVNGLVITSPF